MVLIVEGNRVENHINIWLGQLFTSIILIFIVHQSSKFIRQHYNLYLYGYTIYKRVSRLVTIRLLFFHIVQSSANGFIYCILYYKLPWWIIMYNMYYNHFKNHPKKINYQARMRAVISLSLSTRPWMIFGKMTDTIYCYTSVPVLALALGVMDQ